MSSLRRVVYSPKAYVFIYSRKTGNVVDVSNDVVSGSVQRMINQPSKATVTLRNDDWKYTGKFNPTFYPMDGITIWLQKFAGRPIQVFTGFVDSVPYFQAYPGQIEIKATCTLKRFMYSHFDPGVGFLEWLTSKGWIPNNNSGDLQGFFQPDALQIGNETTATVPRDGGMGQLLHDFLVEVGNTDPSAISISTLPDQLPKWMLQAFKKKMNASIPAQEALLEMMKTFLTIDVNHSADNSDGGSDINSDGKSVSSINGEIRPNDVKKLLAAISSSSGKRKPKEEQMILAAVVMSGLNKNHSSTDSASPSRGYGYFADPNPPGESAAPSRPTRPAGSNKPVQKDVPNPQGRKRVTGSGASNSNLPPGAGSTGSGTTNYNVNPAIEGVKFCAQWNDILADNPQYSSNAGGLGDEQIAEVAAVLAYGYGGTKTKFYSQILDACRDPRNIKAAQQVVKNVQANRNLDNVKSLEIITAAQVQEEIIDSRITWEDIFPQDKEKAKTSEAIQITSDGYEVDKDGKPTKTRVKLKKDTNYSTKFTEFTPDWGIIANRDDELFKIKDKYVKFSDIKYYVHAMSVGQGESVPARGPRFEGDVAIGDIVLVTNYVTGAACKCVYLGVKLDEESEALFGISDLATEALGTKSTNSIYDLNFKVTKQALAPPEEEESLKDATQRYAQGLGPQSKTQTDSYSDLKIIPKDVDNYYKHYKTNDKTTSQRLSEWFYVANRYDLHLLDIGVDHVNNESHQLYLDTAESTNLLSFLKGVGILSSNSTIADPRVNKVANSIAANIVFSFDGVTQHRITFNESFPRLESKTVNPGLNPKAVLADKLYNKKNSIVIVSNDLYPKVIHDGELVRSPDSQDPDNADAGGGSGGGSGSGYQPTWSDIAKISTASAFTTITAFPWDLVGSLFLRGEKSLMNDVPVMQGIDQLCKGSMRHYMSLPNGMFCAFYPDHFGLFGRSPYLEIADFDVIDFNILLNDEPIVTHMYVNGNTINPMQNSVNQLDQVVSAGVVTIDDVFGENGFKIINDPGAATAPVKDFDNFDPENAATPDDIPQYYDGMGQASRDFISTYGARPKIQNEPLIRSPWFEFATAFNLFMYNWSLHTATNVQLAFMPELLAGGIVNFAEQNINMYVEGVVHNWNYATGFETAAYLSAPSTTGDESEQKPGLVMFGGAMLRQDES